MGNSNSQNSRSPTRATSLTSAARKEPRVLKRIHKQASPGPRLLPQPVADGARLLRSTDNGHILQSGGTISGRRPRSLHGSADDGAADLLRVLQRRRSLLDKDDSVRLSGNRKAHSDPDIARSVMDEDEGDRDSSGPLGRSIIAESPSKAKIRSKKKVKAPEPPFSTESPPRELEKARNGGVKEEHRNGVSKHGGRRPNSKSPDPTSPAGRGQDVPPPPPPPPDYNSDEHDMSKAVNAYEKNRRPVEKWKLSKGETRNEDGGKGRVSGSRYSSGGSSNNSVQMVPNGDLQEELRAATKRRALLAKNGRLLEDKTKEARPSPKTQPKKQYYFSNIEALKLKSGPSDVRASKKAEMDRDARCAEKDPSLPIDCIDDHSQSNSKVIEYILNDSRRTDVSDEIPVVEGHLGQFERRRYSRSPLRGWRRGDNGHRQDRWSLDDLSGRGSSSAKSTLSSESDVDVNLNVQLRPTLPRKQMEIPRFSPTDAWRALNGSDYDQQRSSDRLRSEASTDDGDVFEEHIHRLKRAVAPRRALTDRCGDSGISPDAGSPILVRGDSLEHMLSDGNLNSEVNRRLDGVGCVSPPVNGQEDHWIPKEDLMDDSDSGSVDQNPPGIHRYEAPVAKSAQPRFTMPANMFMNWGTPNSSLLTQESSERSPRDRYRRDKTTPENFNSLRNIRRALGLRAREINGIDAQNGIDANWSLSKSAPNSLNVVADVDAAPPARCQARKTSRIAPPQGQRGDKSVPLQNGHCAPKSDARRTSSFSFPREGHVMYLPQYEAVQLQSDVAPKTPPQGKHKKFTYMSTVRKEERRMLEEKLAREVAEKERLREKEIRWMNRVEEEFRKQRDREKVNIRQQLRLLNMDGKKDSQDIAFGTSPEHQDVGALNGDTKMATNWLLRRDSDDSDTRNFSPQHGPPRPEPEGGRSSGDECKENHRPTPEETLRSQVPRKSIYEHLSRVSQKDQRRGNEPLFKSDRRSLSPASQENGRPIRNTSSSPIQRRSSSCEDRRTERPISVFKRIEGSLERSGSGRTFESHTNDLYSVPQKKKSVPKQDKGCPVAGRYRQLSDADHGEVFASRLNGNKDEEASKLSNGTGEGSSKALLTVQPYSPKKEYRRVPFRMAQQSKPNR